MEWGEWMQQQHNTNAISLSIHSIQMQQTHETELTACSKQTMNAFDRASRCIDPVQKHAWQQADRQIIALLFDKERERVVGIVCKKEQNFLASNLLTSGSPASIAEEYRSRKIGGRLCCGSTIARKVQSSSRHSLDLSACLLRLSSMRTSPTLPMRQPSSMLSVNVNCSRNAERYEVKSNRVEREYSNTDR